MTNDRSSLLDSLIMLNYEFRKLLAANYEQTVQLGETTIGLLRMLSESKKTDLTQSQMALQLSVSESTLCTLIEKLRRDGLVIRERLVTDRRKTKLSLTLKGTEVVSDISEAEIRLEHLLKEQLSGGVQNSSISDAVKQLTLAVRCCLRDTETNRRAA